MLHEDKNLLEAYRNGETHAYEALYRAYAEPVRRFLAGGFTFVSRGRTCRFRGTAADLDLESIVQESFARVFAASTRSNYDGERPFKNYLFSIAKNLVLREYQRRERVVYVDAGEDASEALDRKSRESAVSLTTIDKDPETTFADGELQDVTRAYIATLDDEERSFFLHRFVRTLTQEATAEAMGVTRARIKLLEKQQRAAFMQHLHNAGYFVGYTPKARWTRHAA